MGKSSVIFIVGLISIFFIIAIFFRIQQIRGQVNSTNYTVDAGRVLQNGAPIQLKGINVWGFDVYNAYAPDGLRWLERTKIYDLIQNSGLNAVRIPFCPQTLKNVTIRQGILGANPDMAGWGSLQVLDTLLNDLNNRQIYFILAHNRPDCAVNDIISEKWTTATYTEAMWLSDLQFVTNRYKNLPYFVGIDLKDEPHSIVTGNINDINLTWGMNDVNTDWDLAAQRAGAAVLATNPNILIFVEGIGENKTCSSGGGHWWGGNYEPFSCKPLPVDKIPKNKLVLSPHVYGPDVSSVFSYFSASNFPTNMPAIWDKHFGYLAAQGYTIIPAGWGGKYGTGDARDVALQDALTAYFKSKGICSSFFWGIDPLDPQTGGIVSSDWKTPIANKITLLKNYFGSCSPITISPTATPKPSVATPTITPSPTISPNCTRKVNGDADCNNIIDLIDFEIWRKEFTGALNTKNADFDSSGLINIIDFEAWRKGFFPTQ